MRGVGAAFRTPVTWEQSTGNTGDGAGYAPAVTLYGDVSSSRSVRQGPQGETIVDPIRVDLPHDAGVAVGDRITVDGEDGIVKTASVVRGPFGVAHHLHVEAL